MKRFVILGSIVLVVVLGWSGAWLFAANEAKKAVDSLAQGDGVTTPAISCETLNVSGFPFRFDLDCTSGKLVQGDVTATVNELRASVLVYRPTHAVISVKGPIEVADAFTGSRQRLDFTFLEASVRIEDWRIARASLRAENLTLNDTVVEDFLLASATEFELHLIDIPEQHDATNRRAALATFSEVQGLQAPLWQISDGRATLEAELSGLPDDIRDFGAADALDRFRAASGALKVIGLKGDDARGNFEIAGQLTLNERALVDGQLQLTSNGVIDRVGALLPQPWGTLLTGIRSNDGSYSQTYNFRNGMIFSGLIPIGSIPSLM